MSHQLKAIRSGFSVLIACALFYGAYSFLRTAAPLVAAQAPANQWRAIGPQRTITVNQIYSLALVPSSPDTLYAGTNSGVFKTTNGGASWSRAGVGMPYDCAGRAIVVNPANPGTVYVACDTAGIFKSADSGATWNLMTSGVTAPGISPVDFKTLAISAATPNTVYAAGSRTGVFKTADGGVTWQRLAASPGNVLSLAVDPTQANTVYAGVETISLPASFTPGGVSRSLDGGVTWSQVLESDSVKSLAISPASAATLLTSSARRSTNRGDTWTALNSFSGSKSVVAYSPGNANVVYVGANGMWRSSDGGNTLVNINSDFLSDTTDHVTIAVHPTNPNIVYVGSLGRGIFKSSDGGASWAAFNNGLEQIGTPGVPGQLLSYGASYSNASVLYATVAVGSLPGPESVFKSTDGGATWGGANSASFPPLRTTSSSSDSVQAVEPNNPEGVFVRRFIASAVNDSIRTANGGTSWQRGMANISSDTLPDTFFISKASPNLMYGQLGQSTPTGGGAYRSLDGGVTWARTSVSAQPGSTFFVGFSEAQAGVVFLFNRDGSIATLPAGFYRSTDSGTTRTFFPTTGPAGLQWEGSPANGSVFYSIVSAGSNQARVTKSLDGGATWTNAAILPDGALPFDFEVSAANANVVYVASDKGVYKTTDGGTSWQALNNPFVVVGNRLSLDVTGTVLRIQANGQIYEYRDQGGTSCVAPVVQIGPGVQRICEGVSWQFTAVVSAGTPPLTYVWRKNGQVIAGATGATISGTGTVAEAGDYQVTVTNACGTTTSTFPGTLTIASLALLPASTVSVPATASTGVVNGAFSANDSLCPGITASSNVPWITITGPSGPIGFGYAVAANTGAARTGIVTLRHTSGSSVTRTINQAAGGTTCTYAISPTGIANPPIPASGGSGNVTVTTQAGCPWTAATNVSWIIVTAGASGTGNGTVSYTVAANTGIARAAAISIAGLSFTINQAAGSTGGTQDVVWTELANAQLFGNVLRKVGGATDGTWDGRAVSEQSVTSGDATLEFTVSGTNVYRAIGLSNDLPMSNPDQLDFAVYLTNINLAEFRENGVYRGDATIKNGDVIRIELKAAKVSFYVNGLLLAMAVNAPKYPLRVVALMSQPGGEITGAKLSGLSGGSCTYSLAPSRETITAAGFSSGVTLFTQGGCAWSATSNASWLTITSAASGTGSAEIRYQASANTGAARTATITVAGQTLTVSQGAGNQTCTYALTPTSVTVSAAESSGTVSVSTQAGCAWVANSVNAPWLEGVGANTFIGSGSFGYRVLANATTTQRVGTFNVSPLGLTNTGVNFIVTQAGAATGGNGVRWTNLVNTSLIGDILRKTGGAGDGRYDGWAQSEQTFAAGDFYFEFTASGPFVARSAGLSDVAPSGDLNAVDYEIRFNQTNIVEFRERGVYRGDVIYRNGDVFRVAVESGKVNFYVNGLVLAQSLSAPPYPLRALALYSTVGGEIGAAKLFNGRPPVTSSARQTVPTTDLPCRDCVGLPAVSPGRFQPERRRQ